MSSENEETFQDADKQDKKLLTGGAKGTLELAETIFQGMKREQKNDKNKPNFTNLLQNRELGLGSPAAFEDNSQQLLIASQARTYRPEETILLRGRCIYDQQSVLQLRTRLMYYMGTDGGQTMLDGLRPQDHLVDKIKYKNNFLNHDSQHYGDITITLASTGIVSFYDEYNMKMIYKYQLPNPGYSYESLSWNNYGSDFSVRGVARRTHGPPIIATFTLFPFQFARFIVLESKIFGRLSGAKLQNNVLITFSYQTTNFYNFEKIVNEFCIEQIDDELYNKAEYPLPVNVVVDKFQEPHASISGFRNDVYMFGHNAIIYQPKSDTFNYCIKSLKNLNAINDVEQNNYLTFDPTCHLRLPDCEGTIYTHTDGSNRFYRSDYNTFVGYKFVEGEAVVMFETNLIPPDADYTKTKWYTTHRFCVYCLCNKKCRIVSLLSVEFISSNLMSLILRFFVPIRQDDDDRKFEWKCLLYIIDCNTGNVLRIVPLVSEIYDAINDDKFRTFSSSELITQVTMRPTNRQSLTFYRPIETAQQQWTEQSKDAPYSSQALNRRQRRLSRRQNSNS